MVRSRKKTAASTQAQPSAAKRKYVSQSEVPRHSLDDALRVVAAISDQYGKRPTRPVNVASAMGILPTTGKFRSLTGAALAYGLTDGGAHAENIGLTDLARRIVSPTVEGDDIAAKREALMRPRVVREFLDSYDGSSIPTERIGRNVLEQAGVPENATARVLNLIVSGADNLGLLVDIKGKKFVSLHPTDTVAETVSTEIDDEDEDDEGLPSFDEPSADRLPEIAPKDALVKNRKVFISHGSNKKIVAQLKELLSYGDFDPVVSEEKESTARPVPEKVLGDMRGCGAGIIHVGVEQTIVEEDGTEHSLLNYNVLIEIGAAMALYGSNYILLVEQGTKLPSNLQGLYEARYKGDVLDHDATMKLLRTFKQFKS